MTTGGWVVMLLSVGGATTFFFLCLTWVLDSGKNPDATNDAEDVNLDTDEDSNDSPSENVTGTGR